MLYEVITESKGPKSAPPVIGQPFEIHNRIAFLLQPQQKTGLADASQPAQNQHASPVPRFEKLPHVSTKLFVPTDQLPGENPASSRNEVRNNFV